jgi:predicted nucleic-acid-binding Zn-ribbon protein
MTSEQIIKILKDKKATLPCPACGNEDFTLVDGDFTQEFIIIAGGQSSGVPLELASPGRRSLNYIVLVCDNCGYLRQHAMKPLGITPKFRRG